MTTAHQLSATVIIPTHDHGELLRRALASVQQQSVSDIEIFVIGDGVPDITRDVMRGAVKSDDRVTFLDHPKGERHGEAYRHQALADARGTIVCYQSDDDLWLPEHLAVMTELLADADWAHMLPVGINASGEFFTWPVDVTVQAERDRIIAGWNSVPLACSGHTLAAYRQLPYGWRPAPLPVPTDVYMYQQFFMHEWCRLRSGYAPTMLHFPSPDRRDWSAERRLAEIDEWSAIINDPNRWQAALDRLLQVIAREHAATWVDLRRTLRVSEAQQAQFDIRHATTETRADRLQETIAQWHDDAKGSSTG